MKILIYNVNWRGDVLFSTPAIRAIKALYPDAHLACLVTPRCRGMLKGNPDINEVLCFDERRDRALHLKWGLVRHVKQQSFDLAFLFHRSFTRSLLLAMAGIPRRIGYSTKGRGIFLTQPVPPPQGVVHKVDYFLGLAQAAGAHDSDRRYRFYVTHEDDTRADKILHTAGIGKEDPFVVLNPGGNWDPKRWPRERFAELAGRLEERFRYRIIVTGAPKDQILGDEISDKSPASVVSLCGKTTLGELGAVMRRARLVIANDTGPMHIAVGVDAPTLALFGPTRPELTGPIGEQATVLYSGQGMDGLSVEQVFQKAEDSLR